MMGENVYYLLVGLGLGLLGLGLFLMFHKFVTHCWRKRRYGEPVDHSLLMVEYGRRNNI